MNSKATLFAQSWKENWYGFWSGEKVVLGKEFDLEEHVDCNWNPKDFEQIVLYLKNTPCALAAQQLPEKCALCDEVLPSAAYNSDGVWLWPVELGHLVEKHNFILPDKFVLHMRERNFRIAEISEIGDIQELPWPKLE